MGCRLYPGGGNVRATATVHMDFCASGCQPMTSKVTAAVRPSGPDAVIEASSPEAKGHDPDHRSRPSQEGLLLSQRQPATPGAKQELHGSCTGRAGEGGAGPSGKGDWGTCW